MTYTITPAPRLFVVVAWPFLVHIVKRIRRLILKGGVGLGCLLPHLGRKIRHIIYIQCYYSIRYCIRFVFKIAKYLR